MCKRKKWIKVFISFSKHKQLNFNISSYHKKLVRHYKNPVKHRVEFHSKVLEWVQETCNKTLVSFGQEGREAQSKKSKGQEDSLL
jgi:hypothetical protein